MISGVKVSFLIAITLWSVYPLHSRADGLRSNGSDWIRFGPGVFLSAKRLELHDRTPDGHPKSWVLVEKDPSFVKARNWIVQNFEEKLNLSPKQPAGAFEPATYIYVYASPAKDENTLLASVPLTDTSLGTHTVSEIDNKVSAIKTLFTTGKK